MIFCHTTKFARNRITVQRQVKGVRPKKCSAVNEKISLFQIILYRNNMPEMVEYDPQTLKRVYFQEFSQRQSDSKGNLSKRMDSTTLRSHQRHVDRRLSCKQLST